jgi:hypothetical protein
MDDPFWQSEYPGCIWNCQCDAKTTDREPTENSTLERVPVPAGLEGNPATTDEVFTGRHPYYTYVEPHIPALGPLNNPDDIAFIDRKTDAGESFKVHYNCLKEQEYAGNVKAVNALIEAGYGKEIKLLPRIHASQILLRERYYGKSYQQFQPRECPDALIDGRFAEFKTASKGLISKRIFQCAQKAEIAYVELSEDVTDAWLNRFITNQWNMPDRAHLKTIIINNKGVVTVHNRP